MLCLRIDYLTGYAVATDVANRDAAEWPPHPARVFMALAAAWFETGRDPAEGEALRWLETLPPPVLCLPSVEPLPRSVVTQYVPVNDAAGPSAATLQSSPSITRKKQPRTTPRLRLGSPGDDDCVATLTWPDADDADVKRHTAGLDSLAGRVTRIGHSSSLVDVRVVADAPTATHEPGVSGSGPRLRAPDGGLLNRLDEDFGEARMGRFVDLFEAVASSKGKAKAQAKHAFEVEFGQPWKANLKPPAPRRTTVSRWVSYGKPGGETVKPPSRQFGSELLVFRLDEGPRVDVVAAARLCGDVRAMILKMACEAHKCTIEKLPAWLTGHTPDGSADRGQDGHLAIVPLADLGHPYAEGRMLGVGLVLPAAVDADERNRVLAPLLFDAKNMRARSWNLVCGKLGDWQLVRPENDEQPWTLRPERWGAGAAGPSRTWATATPIVLDRFPKAHRTKEPDRWREEVADLIAGSCVKAGLIAEASEVSVDTDTTAWLRGSPRATAKRRRARGRDNAQQRSAELGVGFPMYPARGSSASRPQVHAHLHFAHPIQGPVLLGAGRFGGYGLCSPMSGSKREAD